MPGILGYLALIILIMFLVYILIPELLVHFFGIGSWKRQYTPGVSLTFDDGPDPRYTTRFLEILHEQQVQATFFLVAEKAKKHPELVRMILEGGHTIGSHGYYHRHAWAMLPWQSWHLWNKALAELKKLTGHEPDYVRAPWGGVNLVFLLWCKIKKKKLIGWSADGRDWCVERTPERIVDRIADLVNEGTIILLHDSGGDEGAPNNTAAALPELCTRIRKKIKLPIVPLVFPTWPLSKRISFRIWEKWEHLYARKRHVNRIDDTNIFRLAIVTYHGPSLYNEKGDCLATQGDLVGELHFDNIRLQGFGTNVGKIGFNALKQARLSFPVLVRYIAAHPEYNEIKVFVGVTLINRGVQGLGFSVAEYPNENAGFVGFMQRIIYRIYNPAGLHASDKLGSKPKVVWISKEKLFERYL
ncbi:polysaccharide deacetylase family protein [Dehalobacter sp. DCM]|uniref:polysaccharide deacetylase family protein n=1 Tax=Dehalobacter sp. DCM TaxID=2907827 RepID=UPI0030818A0D|nr:polysaccharide deacetylase family protein [Dehalobacter sp. DCM]